MYPFDQIKKISKIPKRERVVAQFFVYVSQNVMRNILQLTSWGRSGNKHSIKEGQ